MSNPTWQEAAQKLRASAPYQALTRGLGEVVRLPVPAAAWVAELLAEDLGRPLLVVVPREADALAWLEAVQLFGSGQAVYFPAPSLTPYQETEISLLVRAQEAAALDRIVSGTVRTVVATPRALFRRLPFGGDFRAAALDVAPGDDLPIEELVRHLDRFGYHRTDLVYEIGEYAVRGGLVDFFPPGEDAPIRLDLFGDTIEAIRWFDAESQRSEDTLESIRILPLLLFPGGPDAAARLADLLGALGGADLGAEAAERLAGLRHSGGFPGWENYLPLLVPRTASLAELLAGAASARSSHPPMIIAVDPPALMGEVNHHAERLDADWTARRDHRRLAIPPDDLEWPAATVEGVVANAEVRVGDLVTSSAQLPAAISSAPRTPIDFAATTTDLFQGQLPRFPQEVATARSRGERCVIVAPGAHRQRLEDLLAGREIEVGRAGVEIAPGELARGFRLPAAGLALYGEQQILPQAKLQRRTSKSRFGPFLSGLRDLKVGDYVVHSDHGIGRFIALRSVRGGAEDMASLPPALRDFSAPVVAIESEVMEIEYTGGRRLLLPLSRLDQVQKYSGIEGSAPRLDQLGGTSWNKVRAKVKSSLRDMADELLKLYAERQLARAPAMGGLEDSDLVRQFATAFVYEETADQHEAIAAIRQDLQSERPMDRLLCGDVGYGKTEVAMRAAFQAVDAGFQVAVLAPTTILADQHLETFRKRFAGFPVTIEMISRFRTGPETKTLQKRLKEGTVDILIGTHRLLSKDIEMPKLGLMIVDEEQRFGVAQKERLKQAKKNVHVLAMSATPVPRTLQLSLAGVRDLSVIETPPKDRMAVETAILPFNPEVIREAIEHEIERGGQVYYVYNRVESIERMLTYLRDLVPGVRVTVGHGQLEEAELSRRMHAFTERQFDVLLATTIIENGIDIPNVNTMIVHRAERFGLAQLYQLRGRVGRSNQLAYCYLLVPTDRTLSETARKRLAAIREFTDLGAGFRIAARDLEIRGAGNLLGSEQSGQIAAVGIETYLKLLEEAVRELRGEAIEEEPSAQIDLPVAMSIPEGYVGDANLRMEIYRKIAAAEQSREEVLAELTDRFGPPPPAVHSLVEVAALKRVAESLRVQSITCRARELTIRLRRDARVDVGRLIDLVSTLPGASFSPTGVLTLPVSSGAQALATASATLLSLAN